MAARSYTSPKRQEAAAQTRLGILDAAIGLAYELGRTDLTLEQIASRAGRSVQTLLRHFGSLDALIEAAVQRGAAQVADERRVPAGDVRGAVTALVDHYELRGRFVLRLLARDIAEPPDAAMGADRAVTGGGRLLHRDWVRHVFSDAITRAANADELTDLLVVATDVYAWKLLRVDRGLSRDAVQRRMLAMITALIGEKP